MVRMFTMGDVVLVMVGMGMAVGLFWLVKAAAEAAAEIVLQDEREHERMVMIATMDVPEWINERVADPTALDDMLLDTFRTAINESGVVDGQALDPDEREARIVELIQCLWEVALAYGEGVRRLDRLNDD
jgi:hypothetical protein